MIYAMSDIHGCLEPLKTALGRVDLTGGSRLVLCGDYIDYGEESGQVLRFVYGLQREQGEDKVIVLRGNHEEMLLEWLDTFHEGYTGVPDETSFAKWSEWLDTDEDYRSFRTLITEPQWKWFEQICPTASDTVQNIEAARMVRETCGDLLCWLRGLPYYYEASKTGKMRTFRCCLVQIRPKGVAIQTSLLHRIHALISCGGSARGSEAHAEKDGRTSSPTFPPC